MTKSSQNRRLNRLAKKSTGETVKVSLKTSKIRPYFEAMKMLGADGIKLSASTRIAIMLNMREAEPIVQGFDRAMKDNILAKMDKDDKGRPIDGGAGVAMQVEHDMQSDFEAEHEIEVRHVKRKDFDLESNQKITANMLLALEPMIPDLSEE